MYIYVHHEDQYLPNLLKSLYPDIFGSNDFVSRFISYSQPVFLQIAENRIKIYAERWKRDKNFRVILLCDRDAKDCEVLKNHFEDCAKRYDLPTISNPNSETGEFAMVTVIVIEELESWFLGDMEAVTSAYEKIPKEQCQIFNRIAPDSISDPKQELHNLFKKYGYYKDYLIQQEIIEKIAPKMTPSDNRSQSFQYFYKKLHEATANHG